MNGYAKRRVLRLKDGGCLEFNDSVAMEKRLRVHVNGKEALSLYCSPVMIRELVVGFFMTEGIINGNWCAERMTIQYGSEIIVDIPAEGEPSLEGGAITSGCAGGITFERSRQDGPIDDDICIERERLRELFVNFQRRSELYNLTGCIHNAAISDGRNIVALAEDIGRHNAVDKVIGYCILEEIPFKNKIMLVSGRLSSEMASKCARWKIPILVSRTAPTLLAIEIAEMAGMTMIGFMRGNRFNIYTHPFRIK